MAQHKEVMNIREASQYLGISPDTLYKYVSMERIPAFKLGNRWRFKKTVLDEWMEFKSRKGSIPKKVKFGAWQHDRESLNLRLRDTNRAIIFKTEATGRFGYRIEFRQGCGTSPRQERL